MEHSYEPRGGGGHFVMSRGDSSELHEVVSAAASSSAVVDPAAAAGGFDYPLYHGEVDPHLPFPPLFGHASMYGQYRDA